MSQPKEKRESHDPHIATTRSHCHAAYSRPPESETMWEESGSQRHLKVTHLVEQCRVQDHKGWAIIPVVHRN